MKTENTLTVMFWVTKHASLVTSYVDVFSLVTNFILSFGICVFMYCIGSAVFRLNIFHLNSWGEMMRILTLPSSSRQTNYGDLFFVRSYFSVFKMFFCFVRTGILYQTIDFCSLQFVCFRFSLFLVHYIFRTTYCPSKKKTAICETRIAEEYLQQLKFISVIL